MLDRRTRVALAAMALAVFVIANDFTSLTVALPQIERTFHVDVSTVQWVMNAYTPSGASSRRCRPPPRRRPARRSRRSPVRR